MSVSVQIWGKFEWKLPRLLWDLSKAFMESSNQSLQRRPLSDPELSSIPAIFNYWLQTVHGKGSLCALHNTLILACSLPSASFFLPITPSRTTWAFLLHWEGWSWLCVSISHLNSKFASSRMVLARVLWPRKVLPSQKVLTRPLKPPTEEIFLASRVRSNT